MWNSSIGKTRPNDSAPTWRGRPHDTPKRGTATTGPAWSTLRRNLQGYWNYYCVIGNSEQTGTYAHQVRGLVFKWLNRRSRPCEPQANRMPD
jgi:hypothetical protein